MTASSGGSGGRNGDIHHSAVIANPCIASASPIATGDIRLDFAWLDLDWLDFDQFDSGQFDSEGRALTVWATALCSTARSGRRLAGRRHHRRQLRLKLSGRTNVCRAPVMSGGRRGYGPAWRTKFSKVLSSAGMPLD